MDTYVTKNQKTLRCGITTGTCSAAAAKAAAFLLLMDRKMESVKIRTPRGITVEVPVTYSLCMEECVEAMVIKDSGDDPDVTNQAEIYVRVDRLTGIWGEWRQEPEAWKEQPGRFCFRSEEDSYPELYLDGGDGVGRVTREGLEQAVGQAAINKVPRQMIFQAVGEVRSLSGSTEPLLITIRVPRGAELAKRTFNGKLGIVGGISILGTSGILEPMSEKAIVDTIEAEIRQRHVYGEKTLLITPGNYGQSYISNYLHLSMEKSIKCSNYIGETLDLAVSYGMEQVLLVGNIGKLCKLAAGIMNTHSRVADGRWEIFAAHTALCGGDSERIKLLSDCVNTEEMLKLLDEWDMREAVMESMCGRIERHLQDRSGGKCKFAVMLFSERFGFLGGTAGALEIAEELR